MDIYSRISAKAEQLINLMHTIHKNPELSEQEYQTTELLRTALTEAGIEILDLPLKTGLVAIIRGALPGRTVAIRGDIDALPIQEDPSHAVCSAVPGVMHACGHDAHTAATFGAALALQEMRDHLPGNVLVIFQPAEEYSTGAMAVIDTGVFDCYPPSAFFSHHVTPDIPFGKVGIHQGPLMAAQKGFTVDVTGKGSHGAWPHQSNDPVIAAARITEALQTVSSRLIDPMEPFVLSVCAIHGGSAFNIIPDSMTLTGTCRFANNALEPLIKNRITEIAEKTAEAHHCTAKTTFFRELPAVYNDGTLTALAEKTAARIFGTDHILSPMMKMVSEDFALYSEIAPSFMYHVGCGSDDLTSPPLHNGSLTVPDTLCVTSAALLCETAWAYLNTPSV